MTTTVYTDGACSGNPGPGGWAWAVPDGPQASGAAAHTTNQRMEIMAAYDAVSSLPGPLVVVSDSTYVVNCFNQRWYRGWLARDWKNASKQPVANRDLWEPFIELVLQRGDVEFRWVKGHSGDPMNALVDQLAVTAARTQRGTATPARAGGDSHRPGEPDQPGEPDPDEFDQPGTGTGRGTRRDVDADPGAGTDTDEPRRPDRSGNSIDGWLAMVTGHRPPELGGWDPANLIAATVTGRIEAVLEGWATLHPDLVVATGLGLGAEQLAAEAAIATRVPFVAVLPFPDPDAPWPPAAKARYQELLAHAREVVTLSVTAPTSTPDVAAALMRRDRFLFNRCDAGILVWDGSDRRFASTAQEFERRFDDRFVIAP